MSHLRGEDGAGGPAVGAMGGFDGGFDADDDPDLALVSWITISAR